MPDVWVLHFRYDRGRVADRKVRLTSGNVKRHVMLGAALTEIRNHAAARADHGVDPTGCWVTRATPRQPTAARWPGAGSP